MGGHHGHALRVRIFVCNDYQAADPHIPGGSGSRADIFRELRLHEHNGDVVQWGTINSHAKRGRERGKIGKIKTTAFI